MGGGGETGGGGRQRWWGADGGGGGWTEVGGGKTDSAFYDRMTKGGSQVLIIRQQNGERTSCPQSGAEDCPSVLKEQKRINLKEPPLFYEHNFLGKNDNFSNRHKSAGPVQIF